MLQPFQTAEVADVAFTPKWRVVKPARSASGQAGGASRGWCGRASFGVGLCFQPTCTAPVTAVTLDASDLPDSVTESVQATFELFLSQYLLLSFNKVLKHFHCQ